MTNRWEADCPDHGTIDPASAELADEPVMYQTSASSVLRGLRIPDDQCRYRITHVVAGGQCEFIGPTPREIP